MTLDQILDEWKIDSDITGANLSEKILLTHSLHSKYHNFYIDEGKNLIKLERKLAKITIKKRHHYLTGPTDESREKGWYFPNVPGNKILLKDVSIYLESDDDIADISDEIKLLKIKIKTLEEILKSISSWNYTIKNYIDWYKKLWNEQ